MRLLSHARSLTVVERMGSMAQIGLRAGCCIAFFGPETLEIIGIGERGRLIPARRLVRNIIGPFGGDLDSGFGKTLIILG